MARKAAPTANSSANCSSFPPPPTVGSLAIRQKTDPPAQDAAIVNVAPAIASKATSIESMVQPGAADVAPPLARLCRRVADGLRMRDRNWGRHWPCRRACLGDRYDHGPFPHNPGQPKQLFSNFLSPCPQRLTPQAPSKLLTQGATPKYRRSLAGPSTVRGADASVESVWGRRSRPNEPQRKSDTDTRVDPKTSPVPRLEGNPPAVRRAFLFYGKKARRAPVSKSERSPNPRCNEEVRPPAALSCR